jgi:hypothetical protein
MEVNGQLHVSQPLCPAERAVCTHFLCGWVGPTADLGAMDKNLLPRPEVEPGVPYRSARSLVTILPELSCP